MRHGKRAAIPAFHQLSAERLCLGACREQVKPLYGKVLIADDEPSFRFALSVTLAALGLEIVEASTGEEALAVFDAASWVVKLHTAMK